MDENKWEYDYSSSNNPAGDTGYPNVGSSGMNTANTASTFSENTQAFPAAQRRPPQARRTQPLPRRRSRRRMQARL